jgi:transporter family protein
MEGVDPTLGTAIRAVVMAAFVVALAVALGKGTGLTAVPRNALGWIALSGVCGAFSWLAYFAALRVGPAGGVAAVDRLSVVFALALAAAVLGERLTLLKVLGGGLMAAGAVLVVLSDQLQRR